MSAVNFFPAASTGRGRLFRNILVVAGLAAALAACGGGAAAPGQAPPQVRVTTAVAEEMTDWDEFTGRFEAVENVKLRPRVSGYLEQVRFTEGKEVRKGEVLFVIDPRPYQVELDRAEAELTRARAQSALTELEVERAERLLKARAISQEEYDQRLSQRSQLRANMAAAQATVAAARLDLEFTKVVAPIDGRVSRAEVTAGNYVAAGTTVLTSVVSLDPIYVYFEGDERTYLKYTGQARRGERPSSRDTANPVFVGLADESDFPHAGRMNFVDNSLNPATGTIRARAVLDNPDRSLTPGMFARVRLLGSGKYNATLVADEAVGTDQDRRFVLVVNKDNVIEHRAVELGQTVDTRRVVRSGLQPGERVIVGSLHRVRPGMSVAPQQETAAAAEAQPALAQTSAASNSK